MTTFIDHKKIMERKLMADIEILIHAFLMAEIEQSQRLLEKNLTREFSYPTIRTALASDVISCVRKHDYEQRRKR